LTRIVLVIDLIFVDLIRYYSGTLVVISGDGTSVMTIATEQSLPFGQGISRAGPFRKFLRSGHFYNWDIQG
jgi:hypothetical protein